MIKGCLQFLPLLHEHGGEMPVMSAHVLDRNDGGIPFISCNYFQEVDGRMRANSIHFLTHMMGGYLQFLFISSKNDGGAPANSNHFLTHVMEGCRLFPSISYWQNYRGMLVMPLIFSPKMIEGCVHFLPICRWTWWRDACGLCSFP